MKHYRTLIRAEEWLPAFVFVVIGYILTRSVALKDAGVILVAFVPFFLISSFGFIVNDYFDRESDKKRNVNRNPISNGLVNEKSAILLASFLVISGLSFSYFLLPRHVFWLFLIFSAVLFIYSAPPFRMKERFALDIVVHCLSPPLLFLIGYTLFKEINTSIIMLAIEFFILGMTMEFLQEIRDYNADKASGFKTTVIVMGIENSVKLVRLITLSFITLFSLTIYMYFPLYFLLLLLSLLPLIRFILSADIEPDMIIPHVGIKGSLILVPILLVILPLWYGII